MNRILLLLIFLLTICGCGDPTSTPPAIVIPVAQASNAPINPPITPPITNWSKWSEPRITSDMWEGTAIWQTRTNLDTGEVELRCQQASPHGGYYK